MINQQTKTLLNNDDFGWLLSPIITYYGWLNYQSDNQPFNDYKNHPYQSRHQDRSLGRAPSPTNPHRSVRTPPAALVVVGSVTFGRPTGEGGVSIELLCEG